MAINGFFWVRGFAVVCLALTAGNSMLADDVRHLTQAEAVRQAIIKPQPSYPPIARELKLEGKVELEADIAEDGTVETVRILNGNILLTNSAAQAIKKWKFQPFTSGGKPVRAQTTLSFTFKM